MIDWLRSLFCSHDWEMLHALAVREFPASKNPYKYVHHWICRKCLKHKQLTCGE